MDYIREANMTPVSGMEIADFEKAYRNGDILCAKALIYEKGVGLHFNLCGYGAIMPLDQIFYTPYGASPKEAGIVTRINRNVCFIITGIEYGKEETTIHLSRKAVQKKAYEEYVSRLKPGDVIPCNVTHVDTFGIFCDVGWGISALLPIDFISVSRISSPRDRFENGQNIYGCVKSVGPDGRIVLTHKELLGTWLENARMFRRHTTAAGIVRSVENYGVFIELSPNLAGLAEVCEDVEPGDVVNVYIKSILPDKMKVKLIILNVMHNRKPPKDILYFTTEGHIDRWDYSTENGPKKIFTVFRDK